jgi:hypothetical protein
VRVADRAQLVRVRGVAVLVEGGQDRGVARVGEALELGAQETRPRGILGAGLERAQRLEVVVDAPRAGVEARELAAAQLRRLVGAAEEPVARELDLPRRALDRRRGVERVQPLQDAAVLPERRLAARVPQQVRRGRSRSAQPQPVGRPERPEALAGLDRAVLELLGLGPRDPVDRPRDLELEREGLRVDGGAQPVAEPQEPLARVLDVPDQSNDSPVAGEKK